MNGLRIPGIVLIVGGVLGLVYGGFSYTQKTHEANVGSLELAVKEKKSVVVPVAASAGAIAVGTILLLVAIKKN